MRGASSIRNIMKILKYDIQFKTFFNRGLKPIDDRHGVYFVTGRQGSGKNYYAVKLLLQQDKEKVNKVYTNVHSLKIEGYDIHYFKKVTEIFDNIDENCIFLIDEISKKWHRNSPTDKDFYAWLNQCRKRKRIAILITQEWREVPMWLRRPAKYMISTIKILLLTRFGIFMSVVGDAENMAFNKDEGEYECPPIRYLIYKRNKKIADLYDTFEPISEL